MNIKRFSFQKDKPESLFYNGLNTITFLFTMLIIGIVLLMFKWQVIQHEKWSNLAKAQYIGNERNIASRGIIYARDNTVLAIDKPTWNVYATLSHDDKERELFFSHKDEFITAVSGILEIPTETMQAKLTDQFVYIPLAKNISKSKKTALEKLTIFGKHKQSFGLYFEKSEQRVYPNGRLASHILGFVGKNSQGEDVGRYGLEGFFFTDMLSQTSQTYEEKDSRGNTILTANYDPINPRSGKSIYLTIDPNIQEKVETKLREAVKRYQAKSGTVIILEPSTGAIIAMANYPDYNPNEYWKITNPWIFKNKAVGEIYEFGSVEKPITIAIGIESKKIPLDYICDDETGYIEIYDKKIYTWNRKPNGKLTLGGILIKSNNPCAAQVGLDTGLEYYYPKLRDFGYGNFIGLGLQDETTAYLTKQEDWNKMDLATSAFGHSISATPLQVIAAINTIANDGKYMKPYLISKVEDKTNSIEFTPINEEQPISKETANLVTKMMIGVTKEGGPRAWFKKELPNYTVAGKTGTALIPKTNEAGYYDDQSNATFVGFTPTDNPKLSMIVRLEKPKTSIYAAYTAAPTWIEIFKAIADDMGIAPD